MSLEQIIATSSLIVYGFIHYTAPSILVTSSIIAVNIRVLGELSGINGGLAQMGDSGWIGMVRE